VFAQEMIVIRVGNDKIAGDKGSNGGVSENQKYTIYRKTPAGLRPIGKARVSVVKITVCVPNILENEAEFPVKAGDILLFMEEYHLLLRYRIFRSWLGVGCK
jgi:hypothetical protein